MYGRFQHPFIHLQNNQPFVSHTLQLYRNYDGFGVASKAAPIRTVHLLGTRTYIRVSTKDMGSLYTSQYYSRG